MPKSIGTGAFLRSIRNGAVVMTRSIFFFQAEDGIRDHCVTGVQTCALPISRIDVDADVNASASFRESLGGMLRKDLVLTIGLPLAGGLSLRDFAGVLAHEFGHFAQGTAMRLTWVVRSMNLWFARLVYERDSWDETLAAYTGGDNHWAITLVCGLSRLCIWITRRILWVLMFIGHAVSSLMLRQMEFDADRYGARVAGSETFCETNRRVTLLDLAA